MQGQPTNIGIFVDQTVRFSFQRRQTDAGGDMQPRARVGTRWVAILATGSRGVTAHACMQYDIGRIENVHWNPWYSDNAAYIAWQTTQGVGFLIARTDWECVAAWLQHAPASSTIASRLPAHAALTVPSSHVLVECAGTS